MDTSVFLIKIIQLESYLEALEDGETFLEYDTQIMLRDSIKEDAKMIDIEVTEDQLYSLDYIAGMLHAYKTLEHFGEDTNE